MHMYMNMHMHMHPAPPTVWFGGACSAVAAPDYTWAPYKAFDGHTTGGMSTSTNVFHATWSSDLVDVTTYPITIIWQVC